MLHCDAARCVGAALHSLQSGTEFLRSGPRAWRGVPGREVRLAGRGLGGAKPKHNNFKAPGAKDPRGRRSRRKVIYNQPYAPGAGGRWAVGRAGRRSAPRAIWCCTAARDAALNAFNSLMIRAHKLINPKQSPSPF